MPGYETHLVGGVFAFVVVALTLNWLGVFVNVPFLLIVGCMCVSLWMSIMADCDIRTSLAFKLWAIFYSTGILGLLAVMVLNAKGVIDASVPPYYYVVALVMSVGFLASLFLRHRRFMHSFTAAVLVSGVLILVHPVLFLFSLAGYSSHLLLDKFVKSDD